MKMFNLKLFRSSKQKVLVLSGGGARGLYTVGVLKGLEELGLRDDIKAIFGVSVGAVVGSLWSSGMAADEIYDLLLSLSVDKFYSKDIFKKTGGLLSDKKFGDMIDKYLPKTFSRLKIKLYVGTVDTNFARYMLFDKGDLHKTVLGSMSIPGIFPPVKYKNYLLVDGGVLNNFPADLAKKLYPRDHIIGIALNKFKEKQKINSVRENLMINFEVILKSKLLENTQYVNTLFYREIPIGVLSLDKAKMKKVFEMGYKDCLKEFKK